MFKIAKRFKSAADTGEFFAMHEWDFKNDNLKEIMKIAKMTQTDADEFNFDLRGMDWDRYVEKYMLGIRKFVLKDDMKSMGAARTKIKR